MSSEGQGGRNRVRHRSTAKLALLPLALAAVTATAAMTYAIGMVWPAPIYAGLPALAAGHEKAAADALVASGGDYNPATRENDIALAEAPLASTAWVRRAYIAHQRAGRLTPAALESLRSSYRAAPMGPDVSDWRLVYMFDNWTQLPPDLHARAIDEMGAYARFNPDAAALVRRIKSTSGRLAASLVMRRIDGRILQTPPEPGRPYG